MSYRPSALLLSFALLSPFFGGTLPALSASSNIPVDEPGLSGKIDLQAVSNDTSAIAGLWGKCLKSVDTRCYFMDLDSEGGASILTYVSTRDKQFGEDPAGKPHCYNKTDRALSRVGDYTYIWEDNLASATDIKASEFLKIIVRDNELLVFSGSKLQLSLPAVPLKDRETMTIC